jgi:hypothetical protein
MLACHDEQLLIFSALKARNCGDLLEVRLVPTTAKSPPKFDEVSTPRTTAKSAATSN